MIYDEQGNILTSPDLTAGYLYNHHLEDGSTQRIYHRFTQAELEEMAEFSDQRTAIQRVEALEAAGLERDMALMELASLLTGGES